MSKIDDFVRKKLAEAIANSGLSQAKVAEKAGVSVVNLNRILKGVRTGASLATLYKISDALGISINYFFDGLDDVPDYIYQGLCYYRADRGDLSFGVLLKNLLAAKSLRQKDLADMTVGCGAKAIGHYCNDIREPSLDTIKKIAEALEVPVGYFFNEISLEHALKVSEDSWRNARNVQVGKLLFLIKDLDSDGVEEVLKQAEKEKIVMLHNSKKN